MPGRIPDEIVEHYERDVDEGSRITGGLNELELVRTREIVERHLPPGRLSILDVGGGTGVHARWLAEAGHHVELVDPMPRHVEAANALAAEGLPVEARAGDARALAEPADTFDAVLCFGPLYHLIERADRLTAWREALRVTKPGGLVFAAVISRFASLFSGLTHDAAVRSRVPRDRRTGSHERPAPQRRGSRVLHDRGTSTTPTRSPPKRRRRAPKSSKSSASKGSPAGFGSWPDVGRNPRRVRRS